MTKPHVSVFAEAGIEPELRARLAGHLARLTETAASRGVRALLVVESPPPAGSGIASRAGRPRDGATRRGTTDRADRLAARLGTENVVLVHDARERLDPGLLAAEAGTVPAGGALVLLVPPLERWSSGPPASRFVARFVAHLLAYLDEEPEIGARVALERDPARASPRPPPFVPAPAVEPAALAAQEASLDRLAAHLLGDPRALAVVEAPRGHGKSALLGRLAARLADGGIDHRICAARRSALDVLARHRDAGTGGRTALPFLAPDAALAGAGDVLLVDEAASLSLPVIERLLGRWSRLVLATTSAGYESAGRAFALTLPSVLDRRRPGWLRLTPEHPMRWRAGDPLDALIARIVAPASTFGAFDRHRGHGRPAQAASGGSPPERTVDTNLAPRLRSSCRPLPDGRTATAVEVDRDALAVDEPRLAAVSGLLVATHYQSTPLDLVHLLDGVGIRLWSIEREGVALAAALVAIESGVARDLHEDVLARRRRPPHDLLPQLLAQGANRADALDAPLARVVRVAVRAEARRRGLASRLLRQVVRDVAGDVEGVGASFGESPESLALWASNGFRTFHRGFRRNPRSGRRSVAVLRATSARVEDVLRTARAVHRDNEARVAPSGTVHAGDDTDPDVGTAAHDVALLVRFAAGERSLSDTRGALRRLVRTAGSSATGTGVDASSAAAPRGEGPRDEGSGDDDELERWLRALGVDAPPGRRARESALRERVAARLADGGERRG